MDVRTKASGANEYRTFAERRDCPHALSPPTGSAPAAARVYGREEDDAAEVGKPNTWRYDTLTKPCNPLASWMFYALVKVK